MNNVTYTVFIYGHSDDELLVLDKHGSEGLEIDPWERTQLGSWFDGKLDNPDLRRGFWKIRIVFDAGETYYEREPWVDIETQSWSRLGILDMISLWWRSTWR